MSTLPAIVRKMPLKYQKLWEQLYKQFLDEQKRLQEIYKIKTANTKYNEKYYFQVAAHNLACLAIWTLEGK